MVVTDTRVGAQWGNQVFYADVLGHVPRRLAVGLDRELTAAARACFSHTVAVFWGSPDDPRGVSSASGMLLALDRPLLVTAFHVLESYRERQADEPTLKFSIGRGSLVLGEHRVRGVAKGVDLVTIDLSGVQVEALAPHLSYYQSARWPPRRVGCGDSVLITGFPKAYRHLRRTEHTIQFNSCHINAPVRTVSEDHFSCVFEMTDRRRVYAETEAEWPDDYGAFSGCPAFTYNNDGIEFAGVVYEGSKDLHILNMHHADLIADDGALGGT